MKNSTKKFITFEVNLIWKLIKISKNKDIILLKWKLVIGLKVNGEMDQIKDFQFWILKEKFNFWSKFEN